LLLPRGWPKDLPVLQKLLQVQGNPVRVRGGPATVTPDAACQRPSPVPSGRRCAAGKPENLPEEFLL